MNQEPEVAHVVLTDRVGYSGLTMEKRDEVDREIVIAFAECDAVKAMPAGRIIMVDSGDGVSAVFFGSPVPAAKAAIAVHEFVARTTGVPLRIGVHTGLVSRRIDVTGRENVSGPGIERAQRVMNEGDGSAIFVSAQFAEHLSAFSDWKDSLRLVGEREVKHGERLVIYRLGGDSTKRLKFSIVYKRQADPDEALLGELEARLSASGHDVFVDRHLKIGVAWAVEIERHIRDSDAVVLLLSDSASNSEMVFAEVEIALESQARSGKPVLLPVRLSDSASGPVAQLVDRLQHVRWDPDAETGQLADLLVDTATNPPDQSGPVTLEQVGGAVPVDSKFYIVRDSDTAFLQAVGRGDSIVLAKGARQMGKTSLLARAIQFAKKDGTKVVSTDFQSFGATILEDEERLYLTMAHTIARQTGSQADPREGWLDWLGSNLNLESFMEDQVLGKCEGRILWCLDEVDALFSRPYAGNFFGLLRSWHNRRATDPSSLFRKLTLGIGYATEAHLFITDLNQSPFNVGTSVPLHDFTLEHVAELNEKYGRPLSAAGDLEAFYRLTNGHPFLCRRLLDEVVSRGQSLGEVSARASLDDGPVGDHLRRWLVGICQDPGALEGTKSLLGGGTTLEADLFHRLRSSGLVVGESHNEVRFRTPIYHEFLSRHLA